MAQATVTRITIDLDSELLEQLEGAAERSGGLAFSAEEIIAARLAITIGYDLTGTPMFLDHDQHKRLRHLSGSSIVVGAEALLAALTTASQLRLDGMPAVEIPEKWRERLYSRAKVMGKPIGKLTAEYALEGIRERIGL